MENTKRTFAYWVHRAIGIASISAFILLYERTSLGWFVSFLIVLVVTLSVDAVLRKYFVAYRSLWSWLQGPDR